MSAELLTGTCPDCSSPLTFKFGLLTDLGLGVLCFARCDLCFFRGDRRSAKLFVSLTKEQVLEAAKDGLYILLSAHEDAGKEEEEDEGNILDELDDDEEEYSRSNIGFLPDKDEEEE